MPCNSLGCLFLKMKRRRDGRTANQLRPMAVEFSQLHSADGSARFSVGASNNLWLCLFSPHKMLAGDTRILVGINGPRPARLFRLENPTCAVLDVAVLPAAGQAGAC